MFEVILYFAGGFASGWLLAFFLGYHYGKSEERTIWYEEMNKRKD